MEGGQSAHRHGLITLEAVGSCGLSRQALRAQLKNGRLHLGNADVAAVNGDLGRLWPVALLRTEAVLGGKLPSAPKVLQAHHFALHTAMADPSGNFATRVLSTRTESAVGQH